jgi:ubiquitin C-terminal hydrolase
VRGEASFESLLKAWQSPQKLEGENAFACENCYRRDADAELRDDQKKVVYTPAICRYSFEETPQCLIVHLQRFSISKLAGRRRKSSFGYGKDHRDVIMPHQFSPSKILCHPAIETDGLYQLKAMVIHEGATAEFGHYIAIVCRGDRWYRISDSSVAPIGQDAALSCTNAYVAFYEYKSA